MTTLTIRIDDDDRGDVETGMPWTANAYLDSDPDWEPFPGFGTTPRDALSALVRRNADVETLLSHS